MANVQPQMTSRVCPHENHSKWKQDAAEESNSRMRQQARMNFTLLLLCLLISVHRRCFSPRSQSPDSCSSPAKAEQWLPNQRNLLQGVPFHVAILPSDWPLSYPTSLPSPRPSELTYDQDPNLSMEAILASMICHFCSAIIGILIVSWILIMSRSVSRLRSIDSSDMSITVPGVRKTRIRIRTRTKKRRIL